MIKRTYPKPVTVALLGLTMLLAGMAGDRAHAAGKSEELVAKARFTMERIASDANFAAIPKQLQKARGVLIFPELIKGAFIIGGEGGSGVLMGRDANGNWSYPAFYTMGSGSVGLQIGGQISEAVFIIMTEKGLNAIIDNQVKLGADLGIAAGPFGAGAEAATTSNLRADILAYTLGKGLYAGLSLEGAVVAKRDDWNVQYYGKGATPRRIVVEGQFANPEADKLRETLGRF